MALSEGLLSSLVPSVSCCVLVKNTFEPSPLAAAKSASDGGELWQAGLVQSPADRRETGTVRARSMRAYSSAAGTGTPAFAPEPSAHWLAVKYTIEPSPEITFWNALVPVPPSSLPHTLIRSLLPMPPLTATSVGAVLPVPAYSYVDVTVGLAVASNGQYVPGSW